MLTQGTRIKNIRIALNLSQDEFGKIFGVTKQYIYGIEKDKLKLNNEKLVKLLVDYKVNINYLLSGMGDMFLKENDLIAKSISSGETSSNEVLYNNIKNDILSDVKKYLKSEGIIK